MSPRFPEDIIGHPGPVITVSPVEDSIQSTAVRITWSTDVSSSSIVFWGSTTSYADSVVDTTAVTTHTVWVSGLAPATIYHYAVASQDNNGKTLIGDFLFSTASPAGTTGQMNVYFNKTIDTTVSAGEKALGNQDLTGRFVGRINAARHSIDACFYNLSSTPGANIADALVAAKNRGVKVRVICEDENSGNAPFSTIATNGIPIITDTYDVQNGGAGLMHNKFAVIDYKGGVPESVWVWTGSWNPSGPGTDNDRQNSIEIQDVALAGAYTVEFDEMWGSSTQSPNASFSRFGARKTNNTPHVFNINNVPVQCYFSPSDHTTSQIARTLGKAQKSVSVNMYTFTRKDLADSLVVQKNRGRKVRVVLDNSSDLGAQFGYMSSSGVDIHVKGFSGGLLHHKYAIIDATPAGGTPWLITGSHNWSSSAENSNNENTLIIQNDRVANLYLQEFAARYKEAGGSDPIILSVEQINSAVPAKFELLQNYPNPFNPTTHFQFSIANLQFVTLKVYDVLGKEVATLVHETKQPGTYQVEWNASSLASGVYFYQITAGEFVSVRKLLLLR
jgi:phosphatidylserine/phosphatidylglycerophosphate/cardiolipin synthase-like enzyme